MGTQLRALARPNTVTVTPTGTSPTPAAIVSRLGVNLVKRAPNLIYTTLGTVGSVPHPGVAD